ncbi:uncharacterized protein STEHIDRAFT_72016 [Stereum hirsutum FP-91666 SS1]|uniref:uncharacterized protein n=1 Tax=Stereum hirsutum (strain FP-91666) TaxID=721885 RepID=UPI000440F2E1|nr:uncharacterized protein STEHIDRAFT_72016 [Stereum hirsutum FP-91666 SS1]EIM92894.1 hypothetical protein STEHIDRAFT_72016 [Stereum hirsutum FP-91666 SS1]
MPPAVDHPSLHLRLLPQTFYVIQQNTKDPISESLLALLTGSKSGSKFLSITRTDEEISIIGQCEDTEEYKGDWKCIKIAGPMDLGLTGIMCDFTTPLKKAEIPIFAMSTWNTDYVLIPKAKADSAVQVLQEDGWKFTSD